MQKIDGLNNLDFDRYNVIYAKQGGHENGNIPK